MAEMNRRDFVMATAAAACAGVCAGFLTCEQAEAQATPTSGTVDIGGASDFPKGTVSGKFAKSDALLVVHNDDHIYAMSSKCTHKGTPLTVKENKITCTSHGSAFSEQGTAT